MEFNDMSNNIQLVKMIRQEAYLEGEFELVSGQKSDYYIDIKKLVLKSPGLILVGNLVLSEIRSAGIDALGGPAVGAIPIVSAAAVLSESSGKSLDTFFIRSSKKGHGTEKLIEGCPKPNSRVIVVEDVVTTGGTLLHACELLRSLDCKVVSALAIVDREAGAMDAFSRAGFPYRSLCSISDIRSCSKST
jgi:orotate phosphoribosyltransferase